MKSKFPVKVNNIFFRYQNFNKSYQKDIKAPMETQKVTKLENLVGKKWLNSKI